MPEVLFHNDFDKPLREPPRIKKLLKIGDAITYLGRNAIVVGLEGFRGRENEVTLHYADNDGRLWEFCVPSGVL